MTDTYPKWLANRIHEANNAHCPDGKSLAIIALAHLLEQRQSPPPALQEETPDHAKHCAYRHSGDACTCDVSATEETPPFFPDTIDVSGPWEEPRITAEVDCGAMLTAVDDLQYSAMQSLVATEATATEDAMPDYILARIQLAHDRRVAGSTRVDDDTIGHLAVRVDRLVEALAEKEKEIERFVGESKLWEKYHAQMAEKLREAELHIDAQDRDTVALTEKVAELEQSLAQSQRETAVKIPEIPDAKDFNGLRDWRKAHNEADYPLANSYHEGFAGVVGCITDRWCRECDQRIDAPHRLGCSVHAKEQAMVTP